MEDLYENRTGPGAIFGKVFGNAKYVCTEREFSDGLVNKVLAAVHQKWDTEESHVPDAKEFHSGRLCYITPDHHCKSYQELVSDRIRDLDLTH